MAALLIEQRERNAEEEKHEHARKGLWLAHNWPDDYERCAVVGKRHVCRRCLTLYSISIAVMVLALAGVTLWPSNWDTVVIWALCIPATAEFLAEKLLGVVYSARRQVLVTAMVAPALGRGFYYVLQDRSSWHFWGPVLVFGFVWGAAAVNEARKKLFAAALEQSMEFGPGTPRRT